MAEKLKLRQQHGWLSFVSDNIVILKILIIDDIVVYFIMIITIIVTNLHCHHHHDHQHQQDENQGGATWAAKLPLSVASRVNCLLLLMRALHCASFDVCT